jgi:hypothetical protein
MVWQQLTLGAIVAATVFLFYLRWRQKFGGYLRWRDKFNGRDPGASSDFDSSRPLGSDIPEFSSFLVDFFMSGAGAVALMLLTNFLGVKSLYGGSILTIILGLILLIFVFGFFFAKLHGSRNAQRKLIAYACVIAMVVACFFRRG